MESNKLLESLFDKKILNITKLFITKKEQTLYLQEVAKQSRVPIATAYRIVNRLVELELVQITRFKHWKVYSLAQNDLTKKLEKFFEETHTIVDEFVERISAIPEVGRIVELLGPDSRERKYKITVIILGEHQIERGKIKEIIADIKQKYNFTILELIYTFEDFEKQAAVGLYSGKKLTTLFERAPTA